MGILGWWDSLEREFRAAAYGLQEFMCCRNPGRPQAITGYWKQNSGPLQEQPGSWVSLSTPLFHVWSTSAHNRNSEALERSPMPVPSCLRQLTLFVAVTNAWQKQLGEGRVDSGSGFKAVVHHGKEGMVISKGGAWS